MKTVEIPKIYIWLIAFIIIDLVNFFVIIPSYHPFVDHGKFYYGTIIEKKGDAYNRNLIMKFDDLGYREVHPDLNGWYGKDVGSRLGIWYSDISLEKESGWLTFFMVEIVLSTLVSIGCLIGAVIIFIDRQEMRRFN